MCRFFVDIRLYNKAKAVADPFAFDRFRKDKIRQQIEAARPARLTIKSNLPKVNQELALKYMDDKQSAGKKKKGSTNLLDDSRFGAMFANPDFAIDKNAMEYKMLTPVLSRLDKSKVKELRKKAVIQANFDVAGMQEGEAAASSDEDLFSEKDEDDEEEANDSSEDDYDDREMSRNIKKQFKQIKKETRRADRQEARTEAADEEMDVETAPAADRLTMTEIPSNDFKVKNFRVKNDK